MKRMISGVLVAAATALAATAGAQAQGYGKGYSPDYAAGAGGGYGQPYGVPAAPDWAQREWQEREEARTHRREFWRQQRELAEQRAYEAGRREAYQRPWGYR